MIAFFCLVHNDTDAMLILKGECTLFREPEWKVSRTKLGSRPAICGPLDKSINFHVT